MSIQHESLKIRTFLVATFLIKSLRHSYASWLIMGKVNIDNFWSQWVYLEFIFTEMFIEQSSAFHIAFVQIAELIGYQGDKKGKF